jgi:hypothetical protein
MTFVYTPNHAYPSDVARVVRDVGAHGDYFTAYAVMMAMEGLGPRYATIQHADVEHVLRTMIAAGEVTWHPGDGVERDWYLLGVQPSVAP